jgi:hypothetical protein
LAATAPPLRSIERERTSTALERNRAGVFAVSALTVLAVVVHGYHPYAEDGGLYLAGVKRVLDPGLYPYGTGFTTAHLRFSLFAPMVAFLVRASHLGVMAVIAMLYVASIWATLFAGWQLATRAYMQFEARLGAVSLLALLLTVPVAGTSLMLMDPYVSARSISTPCGLFALVAMHDIARGLRQHARIAPASVVLCIASLGLSLVVHPLMGVYALGCVLIFAVASLAGARLQLAACLGLCVLAAAVAILLLLLRWAPAPPPGYLEVARTRTYWFVSQWHWYEVAGLIAPMAVLAGVYSQKRSPAGEALKSLAQTGLIAGGLAVFIALLFARVGMSNYTVAKLQPLRVFQTVYVFTILCVGAAIGQTLLKRRILRWAGMIGALAVLLILVQCAAFSNSSHLEFPGIPQRNGWEQAFTWIRNNTDKNAVFALDADYITASGEDSQNFRAIAERSVIPDYSKDGGIASIAPDLTAEWIEGESAQKGLDRATDADRIRSLRLFPAQWIVLPRNAATAFRCDYENATVKVCRLPDSRGPE